MVTETKLAQVAGLNDVEGFIYPLPKPLDKYIYVFWYHDIQYASDEYGCTTLPNIFHHWLVDVTQLTEQTPPNVPHINLFGSECTPYVYFRQVQFFQRQGKLYMLLGGYEYGSYVKIAALIDITNPANPVVVKVLKDTQGSSWWNSHKPLYFPARDEILLVSLNGIGRACKFDQFLNATDFTSCPQIFSTGFSSAVDGFIANFTEDKVYIAVSDYNTQNTYRAIYDATGTVTTITQSIGQVNAKYALVFVVSGGNVTRIDLVDKSTLSVVSSINVNMPFSEYYAIDIGDGAMFLFNGTSKIYIIKYTGEVYEYTLSQAYYGAGYISGSFYAFKHVSDIRTSGEIYRITIDNYYYVERDPNDPTGKTFILKDKAGNPVPNKTIVIAKHPCILGVDGYVTATTDASGKFTLPSYGVFVIAGVF